MKYPTKAKRLIAVFDAHPKVRQGVGATLKEVSQWAVSSGLYPVPGRDASVGECAAWETILAKVLQQEPPNE